MLVVRALLDARLYSVLGSSSEGVPLDRPGRDICAHPANTIAALSAPSTKAMLLWVCTRERMRQPVENSLNFLRRSSLRRSLRELACHKRNAARRFRAPRP